MLREEPSQRSANQRLRNPIAAHFALALSGRHVWARSFRFLGGPGYASTA